MAKTEVKVGLKDANMGIAIAYGSEERAQAGGNYNVNIEYAEHKPPSKKKLIAASLMLHVDIGQYRYPYNNSYPSYSDNAGYENTSFNPPTGYEIVTRDPTKTTIRPSPVVPVSGIKLIWYETGYPYIKKEYDPPSSLAHGDWIEVKMPSDHLPYIYASGSSITIRQMRAYTPQTNGENNRIPGKVAYKWDKNNTGSFLYVYDFWARINVNITDSHLEQRSYLKLVYADYPQIPTVKSPILGETVAPSGGVVRFSWAHNPSPQSNLPQKGYNLQISGDGLTWETITATSTNQYADVPIAKIPSGNFYWRVQTIDTDDAPSDYSDQAYAYYGTAPTAPSIVTSVFTAAKPRLIWTTTFAQSAYKVQILKGATYIVDITAESSDQFYDIPVALENGEQYTVRVSARDEAAHYSAWAEDAITANYIIPTTPSFVLSKKKDSIDIVISHNQTGILRYDIYRFAPGDTDFIRIGSTTTKKYKDWSVMDGEVRYKVIAVSDSGESKGAQQRTTFELTTGWLTPVDDPAHPFEVRYNVQDRYHTDYDVSMMEYAGREKPVAEFGQIAQRSISVSFATNDKDAYKALERVIRQRKTVLYRNARMKMYGVCISPSDQPADYYGMIYNLSFVINEVEHSEVV